jgi:putative dimethyl sulfoxide reductase chaperone
VYTSPRGLLMQEARDRVVEWYRQAGMQRAGGFPVPEDHLALELEYVAQLCEPTSRALESQDGERALACLRAQRAFLEEHLLNWVPRLCEDILRLAATDFYQGIALLSAGYLAADQNLLAELCQAQPAG